MRGRKDGQELMLTLTTPNSVVPQDHPIRPLKELVDEQLVSLNPVFEKMYSFEGRPSIPPERLVKATLLMALFSIRSERQLCEQIGYNLLFRYFLDMNLAEAPFAPTVFTKNRDRFLEYDLGGEFFKRVVDKARASGLVSEEHFSVDGSLIEAWASMKSFRPKAKDKGDGPVGGASGNDSVNFHGEKRSNKTHQSVTDPEARLLRKARGKEAKLCFALHTVSENRHGIIVANRFSQSVGTTETKEAVKLIRHLKRRGFKPKSVGADKGYHNSEFVTGMRRLRAKPHVAQITGRHVNGLDGRTARHENYELSQRKRKLIEQGFGWLKTVAGFRKTRYRGVEKNQLIANFLSSAFNLVKMAKLLQPRPA
jgi:transposase